jgi:2-oxoisovalerate dehydrogenase E1 component
LRGNDPVIFFEHRAMLDAAWARRPYPGDEFIVPYGRARLVREGPALSVISYGWMLHKCLEAADAVGPDGIAVDVVDLRTLAPLDRDAILGSVRKTGKALIVHEASRTGGIGGEIAALIAEEAFESLDGPVVRLASEDAPVPHNPGLEAAFQPAAAEIAAAIRRLAAY